MPKIQKKQKLPPERQRKKNLPEPTQTQSSRGHTDLQLRLSEGELEGDVSARLGVVCETVVRVDIPRRLKVRQQTSVLCKTT